MQVKSSDLRITCQGGGHCTRDHFFILAKVRKGGQRETPVSYLRRIRQAIPQGKERRHEPVPRSECLVDN